MKKLFLLLSIFSYLPISLQALHVEVTFDKTVKDFFIPNGGHTLTLGFLQRTGTRLSPVEQVFNFNASAEFTGTLPKETECLVATSFPILDADQLLGLVQNNTVEHGIYSGETKNQLVSNMLKIVRTKQKKVIRYHNWSLLYYPNESNIANELLTIYDIKKTSKQKLKLNVHINSEDSNNPYLQISEIENN